MRFRDPKGLQPQPNNCELTTAGGVVVKVPCPSSGDPTQIPPNINPDSCDTCNSYNGPTPEDAAKFAEKTAENAKELTDAAKYIGKNGGFPAPEDIILVPPGSRCLIFYQCFPSSTGQEM